MEVYFSTNLWNKLYNCSGLTFEEWSKFGKKDFTTGIFSIVLGLVLQVFSK